MEDNTTNMEHPNLLTMLATAFLFMLASVTASQFAYFITGLVGITNLIINFPKMIRVIREFKQRFFNKKQNE
jgi:hypothetical protein